MSGQHFSPDLIPDSGWLHVHESEREKFLFKMIEFIKERSKKKVSQERKKCTESFKVFKCFFLEVKFLDESLSSSVHLSSGIVPSGLLRLLNNNNI